MNVTRGVKSAAVIEMTAKRSPIGNAISFLIQTKRRERSIARRRPRMRRPSVGGGGTTGAARDDPAGGDHDVARLLERREHRARRDLALRVAEAEVAGVARGLERERRAGEQPHVVAGLRGAEREPGERQILLRAVADRVQPGAEAGEAARVAGELAVDAIERERRLEQQRAGDHPGPLPGRERRRGDDADRQREQRDGVGRPAPPRRPAGDVLRVRADEMGGEEAVVALDRVAPARDVLVARGDPLGGVGELRPVCGAAPRRARAAGAGGPERRSGPGRRRAARARRRAATPRGRPARPRPRAAGGRGA